MEKEREDKVIKRCQLDFKEEKKLQKVCGFGLSGRGTE